jgi:hypothetical protein
MLKTDDDHQKSSSVAEINKLLVKLSMIYIDLFPGESKTGFKEKYWLYVIYSG